MLWIAVVQIWWWCGVTMHKTGSNWSQLWWPWRWYEYDSETLYQCLHVGVHPWFRVEECAAGSDRGGHTTGGETQQ